MKTLLLSLIASALLAQNSGIQGLIIDPSGAAVPDVTVRAVNVATGVATTVKSNERGLYSAPFLPQGTYRITAEKEGFSPVTRDNLKLDVEQTARLDFELKVGSVAETVEVSAAAVLLESETTAVGQVIENKRIVEMPLNLRNYLELAKFAVGVLPGRTLGRGSRTGGEDGTEGGFVALGQHAYQTNVLLDGVDNSSRASGGPLGFQAQAVKPPVDAVAEFKVVTNNNSAEYGYRVGGKVLVSTRSGTNAIHGSLYEFLRNEKFDGANFFANRSGARKPTLRQNQFGGTIGGPVIKNRTFYFFSYQGTRIRRGRSFLATVPSESARNGDFSREGPRRDSIFDPLTTTGTGAAVVRQPFANARIPASRFDPVVVPIAANYPLPNIAGREFLPNNHFFAPTDVDDSNQYDIRVDHNLSDKDRIFGRWSIRRDNKLQNGPLPQSAQGGGLGQTIDLPGDNWVGSWTRSISPTVYNEARFGYTHFPTRFDILDTENLNKKYGIKGAPGDGFNDGLDHGLARFTPADYGEIGSRSFWPNNNFLDNIQFNDNLLIQRGSHAIKAGMEYRRSMVFREASRFRRGQFAFNRIFTVQNPNVAASRAATGNGFADMLMGMASGTTVGNQNGEDIYNPYWGFYLLDDWKISRNLTLNIGVRWEFFHPGYFPFGEKLGRGGVSRFLTEFNVAPSDARYETFVRPSGARDCGCTQDLNNFAPRIGLAYKLNDRTVLRSGFGLFYGEADNTGSESARFGNITPDFTEVNLPTFDNITPSTLVRNGFVPVQLPAATPVANTGLLVSKDAYPNQYVSQWFFDIQREFGDMIFAVGYQGAKGTQLFASRNINNGGPHPSIPEVRRRVRPTWSGVSLRDTGANSLYNAMTAKAEKRFSKGLTFVTSYTWSKNIDQANENLNEGASGRASEYNLSAERGLSDLDRRHNFVTSFTYELPFGRGRGMGANWNAVADAVLGGWQVGGILSLRSGFPFDISYPGDPQNSGTRNRGNRIASGKLEDRTIDRWFDQFAFVASDPGVIGNTGRNILTGPNSRNFDLILGKRFTMPWEGHAIQFRMESFNLTNTPTFGQPNSGLRGPATATITQADEPRRIQFALKYTF
ncbi:MAG: carboxypeptidase-like regulatory domain-containing protein [Bryobacteraceae bacterium]|nr:carboxypeptidase-like regulatory domain-containing protein [Bryobacteraceae bacterium]